MALSHLPDEAKYAKTILLKKRDKPDYADPGSWRPVALLSSLSKTLERLFANSLREIGQHFKHLPMTQFGCAGKSSAKALQCLANQVYRGWALKGHIEKSSVLGFDIEGAYNAVSHSKLLEVLKEMDIPNWIVKFVESFLSNRSTTLELPGHKVEPPFYVDIGLPQGSPLSPILFLFFTAPLFKNLLDESEIGTKVQLIGYVDDLYLLVTSENEETNCRLLEKYFERIAKRA